MKRDAIKTIKTICKFVGLSLSLILGCIGSAIGYVTFVPIMILGTSIYSSIKFHENLVDSFREYYIVFLEGAKDTMETIIYSLSK